MVRYNTRSTNKQQSGSKSKPETIKQSTTCQDKSPPSKIVHTPKKTNSSSRQRNRSSSGRAFRGRGGRAGRGYGRSSNRTPPSKRKATSSNSYTQTKLFQSNVISPPVKKSNTGSEYKEEYKDGGSQSKPLGCFNN